MLIRVHSECLTGDVFGSLRCDCGPQLDEALDRIVAERPRRRRLPARPRGSRDRPAAKLQAYALQDGGRDTVDANLDLGLPADARDYGAGAQILRDLGVAPVRLLTNNPDEGRRPRGLRHRASSSRSPLTPRPNDHNLGYLRTKRDRMGHSLARPASRLDTARPTQ